MKNPLASVAAGLKAAFATARSDIDDLRRRIEDLKADREKVEHLPADFESSAALVRRVIAESVKLDGVKPYRFSRPSGVNSGDVVDAFRLKDGQSALPLLAQLFPDRVEEMLLEQLPKGGVTDVERAARLAKIDREIMTAEIAEEVALREIEATMATTMPRRRDANPAILLAPDAELN